MLLIFPYFSISKNARHLKNWRDHKLANMIDSLVKEHHASLGYIEWFIRFHGELDKTMVRDTLDMANQLQIELHLDSGKKQLKKVHKDLSKKIERINRLKNRIEFDNDWLEEKIFEDIELIHVGDSVALLDEGVDMHHCVGGYVNRCKSGESSVYSVYEGGNRIATLEVKPNAQCQIEKQFKIAQLRSYNNEDVSEELWRKITMLVNPKLLETSDG